MATIKQLPRALWIALLATLGFKILLAAWIPITGDEVYFTTWAKHLDWSYYDHGGMTGWLLWPLMKLFPTSVLAARLPAILLSTIIGLWMYALLVKKDATRAYWTVLLYWISPLSLFVVMILSDTPLVFFIFTTAVWTYQRKWFWAGMGFGMGLVSKYLMLLTAPVLLAAILFQKPRAALLKNAGYFILGAIPWIATHLWWNATHCWANIRFNFPNRAEGEEFSIAKLWQYLLLLIYVFTPFLVGFAIAQRKEIVSALRSQKFQVFAAFCVVPLTLLAMTSLKMSQSLHWLFGFATVGFFVLGATLPTKILKTSIHTMYVWSGVQAIAVLVLLSLPLETWKTNRFYDGLMMFARTGNIINEIEKRPPAHVAAISYTFASVLSFHSGTHYSVFGVDNRYGREDDFITDWRSRDGDSVMIASRGPFDQNDINSYFQKVDYDTFQSDGVSYHLAKGEGFRFDVYKKKVIDVVKSKFYSAWAFLPDKGCPLQ